MGLQLPSTLAFDYPSLAALAAHVHSLLAPSTAVGSVAAAVDTFFTSPPGALVNMPSNAIIQVTPS